jgi:diadenylate cyclase
MTFLIPHFSDLLDIVIISVLIYQSLLIMRKTGSLNILYGFIAILTIYILTTLLNLHMVSGLVNNLKNLWILIIVILFQQEIRELLSHLNIYPELLTHRKKTDKKEFNSSLIDAISAMSFRKIGCIIVVENKKKLYEYMSAGEILDSVLSLRLILTIFNPKSVLHDGAIIIREDRIIAAKVVLPLSKNLDYKQKYGTRHLAAIGISEVTDALAIVVSEQSGRVSIARKGELQTDVAFEELMQIITDASR